MHVREMMNVRVKHRALCIQFADGFFTIAKTQNSFSMIGFDQKPEQQNKELKMHGGILNMSDECVFTNSAVAGPEMPGSSRSLRQACLRGRMPFSSIMAGVQAFNRGFFSAHTNTLVIAFQEAGNPFDEDSHEVVIVDAREYAR